MMKFAPNKYKQKAAAMTAILFDKSFVLCSGYFFM